MKKKDYQRIAKRLKINLNLFLLTTILPRNKERETYRQVLGLIILEISLAKTQSRFHFQILSVFSLASITLKCYLALILIPLQYPYQSFAHQDP